MLAGLYAAAQGQGVEIAPVPRATALGSLVHYITHAEAKNFQPANITFDLLEPLDEETRRKIRDKKERHRMVCERALAAVDAWWAQFEREVRAACPPLCEAGEVQHGEYDLQREDGC